MSIEFSRTALIVIQDLFHFNSKISIFLHFITGYQVNGYCMGLNQKKKYLKLTSKAFGFVKMKEKNNIFRIHRDTRE